MRCEICGKETNDSAVFYQADLVGYQTDKSSGAFADTTTTVKTYKNVIERTLFCCKDCRSQKGLWKFSLVITIIGAALTALCWLGYTWNETYTIFMLGVIGFGTVSMATFFLTISNLIYPYENIVDTLKRHLEMHNKGHTWLTQRERNRLR